jgi:hypothetical protein
LFPSETGQYHAALIPTSTRLKRCFASRICVHRVPLSDLGRPDRIRGLQRRGYACSMAALNGPQKAEQELPHKKASTTPHWPRQSGYIYTRCLMHAHLLAGTRYRLFIRVGTFQLLHKLTTRKVDVNWNPWARKVVAPSILLGTDAALNSAGTKYRGFPRSRSAGNKMRKEKDWRERGGRDLLRDGPGVAPPFAWGLMSRVEFRMSTRTLKTDPKTKTLPCRWVVLLEERSVFDSLDGRKGLLRRVVRVWIIARALARDMKNQSNGKSES